MEAKLLSKDEVCEWLNISRATLDRWRTQGLPFIKAGKTVRFDQSQVQKWLDENSFNQK